MRKIGLLNQDTGGNIYRPGITEFFTVTIVAKTLYAIVQAGGSMRIMFFVFILMSYGISAQEFSVSTQNLWHYPIDYSRRVESLKDNLQTDLADIASFQEAFFTGLSGEISLLHEFLDYTGYVHRFHKTSEKFHFYEGLAIAGRYPIVSNEVKQYVLPHDSKKRPRRMLLVPFRIAGETIYVFNLHLSPFPENVHLREDQLKYESTHSVGVSALIFE